MVAVQAQLQEAVALGQRGVSGSAGSTLQAGCHRRAVEAPSGSSAAVVGWEDREGRTLALALAAKKFMHKINTPTMKYTQHKTELTTAPCSRLICI